MNSGVRIYISLLLLNITRAFFNPANQQLGTQKKKIRFASLEY